ncbi:MAG: hypothetical protein ACOYWZ_04890 [Bacillota bacterium]
MKFLRGLLAVFLVLTIVGGLGYIVWSTVLPMYYPGMNAAPNNQPHTQAPGQQNPHGNTPQNNVPLNTTAIQNRDKLSQAISTINQAIDLISIDPYSKATLPQESTAQMHPGTAQGQASQGSGTINIFPEGNSSVNISPNGNNTPNNQTTTANTNQGTTNMQQNQNYVFDQGKLQQLHNGIFTLAQGIMTINQLNDDLLVQSAVIEANPPNYETYVIRYNTALRNKTKLNNAMNLLSQASTLINVNPYASPNGYPYNKDAMAQLHQGVYKLAQGMAGLNGLNEDFTNQMAQAAMAAQNIIGRETLGITHGTAPLDGLFGNINLTTLFNIILIVLLAGLILGVLGAVISMLGRNGRSNPDKEPNVF